MPARVHALIVARSGETGSAPLSRTLEALRAQSLPPAAVTVIVQGDGDRVRRMPGIGHLVEGIIEARAGTSFSEAIALAQPRVAANSSVWLLADDTAPEPDALQLLAGALERFPSA
ncbi:MAG: glycosyltransferase family A protein, partial [Microbacterium sp.]